MRWSWLWHDKLFKGTIQWSDKNWYMVYFSPLIMNINFKNSFSTPIPLKIAPKAQNLVLLMTEKWSTVPHWKLRNDQRFQIDYWETINGSRLNTEKRSTAPDWILRNDQWCQIENWETIGGAKLNTEKRSTCKIENWETINGASLNTEKWSIMLFCGLIIISPILHCWSFAQYLTLHHWSFLSFQFYTIYHFSVGNLALLIVSQFSILHH